MITGDHLTLDVYTGFTPSQLMPSTKRLWRPSSGELQTVDAATGIQTAKVGRSLVIIRPWLSIQDLHHPNSCQAPVAASTDCSPPDDGRKRRLKHAGYTCSFNKNKYCPELHLVGKPFGA